MENKTYQVTEDETKQKYYVLNMFPYPSGAGLHVGHPLGYIASDIYARYKRLQGFNVLNPMGYDAYGLPAEQYAIQTGQHPAITTVNNINRYREQLDKIGFSFDWNREIRTCAPEYYHWTQWAFQKMFNSYYCNDEKKARPIEELTEAFAKSGNEGLNAACSEELHFTADEWNAMSELTEMVAEEAQGLAESKAVTLTAEIEPGILVKADQTLMMRIWLNLLTNAVKYGRQQGQIWLTLKSDGKNAVGTVRDDGIGISAAELPKIWKRFYRVNTARSSGDDSGTGLGLAMVKWMVESHGGTVSAVSTLGAGSTFSFTIPLRPS